MARPTIADQGFTLIELIIAIILFAAVLLGASNLLISFGGFSARVVRSEASLMGTALGTFEEIVRRITHANHVDIPAANFAAPSIDIRMSPEGAGATADHANDVFHTFWLTGTQLNYKTSVGVPPPVAGASTVAANDVTALSFVQDPTDLNRVTVTLDARTVVAGSTHSGAREHLQTTVIMRGRSAN